MNTPARETWKAPWERAIERRRAMLRWAVVLAGFVVVTLLDHRLAAFAAVRDEEWLEGRGWYQVLRQWGYVPTWILIGFILGFHELWLRHRKPGVIAARAGGLPDRTLLVVLAPILAGAAAELLKLVFARERPDLIEHPTSYVWRGLFTGFADGSNLGLPSSHAAVAFAGSLALARVLPGAAWILVLGALGCGISRMLAEAHYASDVYLACVVSWLVVAGLARVLPRERAPAQAGRGRSYSQVQR